MKKTRKDIIYEIIAKEFVPKSFRSGVEARRLVERMFKVAEKIDKVLANKN